jgi:hypothetical protein
MTCERETLNVKGEARPRADGRWLIAYSTGEDNPGLFFGPAIGHTPYAIRSFIWTRDGRRLTNHACQLKSL